MLVDAATDLIAAGVASPPVVALATITLSSRRSTRIFQACRRGYDSSHSRARVLRSGDIAACSYRREATDYVATDDKGQSGKEAVVDVLHAAVRG